MRSLILDIIGLVNPLLIQNLNANHLLKFFQNHKTSFNLKFGDLNGNT